MYNKAEQSDIEKLREIAGSENVFCGSGISEDYSHDELGGVKSMPDVLVRARTTEEISAVMKLAYERRIPVVVRGSGTGLVGSAVAVSHGIMLETTKMNRILELDRDNLTVTVQPGVLLMELAEFTTKNGFLYPPDPGEKSATIGGNISTNAGGMRAVKYGVTRDYVRGLTVVLPNGDVEVLGGKIVKNSSGYSLKDLVIGSEGTLGIITEAILKVVPLPAASVSLLVPFHSMEEALDAVPVLIRSNLEPTAIEYMSRDTIGFAEQYLGKRFPDTAYTAYLLLTFDGSSEKQVAYACEQASELCLEQHAEDVYLVDTDERKEAVWTARGAFLEAIKASTTEMDECDVVVPRKEIADYIRFTHAVSARYGVRIPSFGHAGDGNLHIYICRDDRSDADWENTKALVFEELYREAFRIGGQVSGEHGIGYAKRAYLRERLGERQLEIMRGIKAVFDPENILNPGKIF